MPGAPTFLPTKSLASLIVDAIARDGGDRFGGDRVHDRGAGDRDEIEPAVDRLQEDGARSVRRSGSSRRRWPGECWC